MKFGISLVFCFFLISFVSFTQTEGPVHIPVSWKKSISGDFSFTKNWSYSLGVDVMSDGKAGCADGGFCPERCYGMLDENGIVLKDSSMIFYQLLDTTHEFHTIKSETNAYEFDGTNIIEAIRSGRVVNCYTRTGISTHCSLQLEISGDSCKAMIILNSITPDGDALFFGNGGSITIDKKLWKKGILKAEFKLSFEDHGSCEPLYWEGLIYTKMTTKIGI